MRRIVSFAIVIVLWNLLAFFLKGIDIPIPSSYITLMITFNAILAFFSIFIQRIVIALYEANVFEEPESTSDYVFKYLVILTSGINYYIQIIFRRLPFFLNKLAALMFFIFLFLVGFGMIGIFE